ncbi:hypothetical protein AAHA92_16411 [Salvia divinorum]|uniref:DUF7795 domain-containing protein n=1 Tax=Salvia divinorum TaxID=28513 RepID=A0ABD1GVJ8_SALDI
MMRIAQFDELVSTGSRFLVSFQQALGFLGRSPIDKTSILLEGMINAHGSRKAVIRSQSCAVSYLYDFREFARSFIIKCKSKVVVDELESLLGNAASIMQTSSDNDREDISSNSVLCIASTEQTANEKDEDDISCNFNSLHTVQGRPDLAEDYGSMMAIVYSMVKQDYTMQARIVFSLSHKSSQEELETYCQMWSLRPFVDDDIVSKAWNFTPGR